MSFRLPKHGLRLSTAARRCVVSVAWLLFFLSTWRAPVPWLHAHEASFETGQIELASHLIEYHAGDHADSGEWHWHFVMIDEILRGGGCPLHGEDDESERQTSIVVPRRIVSWSQSADDARSAAACCAPQSSADAQARRTVRFISRPARSPTSCRQRLSLLCISRC